MNDKEMKNLGWILGGLLILSIAFWGTLLVGISVIFEKL
jgi:hypothetical protein